MKRAVSFRISTQKKTGAIMLKNHRLATASAVIGALAIAAPVAGAAAATTPAASPVSGAYQAGITAAQGGIAAGEAATLAGWQAGANALGVTFGSNPFAIGQFGIPGMVNLGPTGPLGPLGQYGPLGGTSNLPTGLNAWNLGPTGPLGPGGALGG
jgi:hypothetical protein